MKPVILIVALIISANLFATEVNPAANSGKISGVIIDSQLKQPLEYANITIYSAKDSALLDGTVSKADGSFVIENLPYGDYYLVADFIGYKKQRINNISISKDKKVVDLGKLSIEQAVQNLDEVEVVGEKKYVEYKIDKKVVNVSQNMNATGGSAADALVNVPSVTVDMDGNVALRGSSSFTVLIDGKPSPVEGTEILKQIPAEAVENIEIITNPSAKYDPDGTTGIINIVMKKQKDEGVNGMVSANLGTWNKFGSSANLNMKSLKRNFFLNASYNRTPTNMEAWEDRSNFMNDTTLYLTERSDRVQTMRPWNVTAGVDNYLNERNTLTFMSTLGSFGFIRDFETTYHAWDNMTDNEIYINSDNYLFLDGMYLTAHLNYDHKFKKEGHNVVVSAAAWKWHSDEEQTSDEEYTDQTYQNILSIQKNRFTNDNYRDNLRIKTDYTLPLKKGKFEAGFMSHLNPGSHDYIYEDFDPDAATWSRNTQLCNEIEYRQDIHSAYSTFSGELKGFTYQLGLRGEYMDRLFDQKTTGERFHLEVWNYYPTIHISKQLKNENQLQVSYSRRINRPQPWELNPFPDYSDTYNLSKGNPMLKPEDIDSYEFNYFNKLKKGFFSAGLYYRVTHDTKAMSINIDEQNRLFLFYENIDNTYAMGTELMMNLDPNKWLNVNVGGNLYNYQMKGFVAGSEVDKTSLNWDARIVATFKIKQTTKLQISGTYNGPSVEAVGTRLAMYDIGFAMRKDIMKRKASLSLNIEDIFGTSAYKISTDTPAYKSEIGFKGEAPIVRLTFVYRINNYQRRQDERIDLGVGAG